MTRNNEHETLRLRLVLAACAVAALLTNRPVGAEEPSARGLYIVNDSTEIGLSVGYFLAPSSYAGAQPVGVHQGAAAELAFAFRTRRWAIGVSAQYAELGTGDGDSLHALKVGPSIEYHLAPDHGIDPWLGATAGYRLARLDDATAFGFEVARLWVGLDLGATTYLSVGPFASVGVDAYPWLDAPDGGDASHWFGSGLAGIKGRFELSAAALPD